jgi:hypothetical protein
MLLGFDRRFETYVVEGSKTHSIRALGKRRPFRVGDRCDCYGDSRQKTMHPLGHWPCVKVENITITAGGVVIVEGQRLTLDEKDALAYRDGFRETGRTRGAFNLMMAYWRKRLKKQAIWKGQIIHWRFDSTLVNEARA